MLLAELWRNSVSPRCWHWSCGLVRLGFMVPFSMSTHLNQAGPPSASDKGTDEVLYLSTSVWWDTAVSWHAPSLKWGAFGSCCLLWGAETLQTLPLPRESLATGAEILAAAAVGLSATGAGTPHWGTRGQLSRRGRWGWAVQFLLFVREKHKSGSCRRCWHKKELGMGWVGNSH